MSVLIPARCPDWLRADLAGVLTDLDLCEGFSLTVASRAGWYDVALLEQGAAIGGCSVRQEIPGCERLVIAAEGLQEALAESARAWGEGRPPCRAGHGHPAKPDVDGGQAVWLCPADREVLALIGALGAGSAAAPPRVPPRG